MPTPHKDESREEFIKRYMSDPEANKKHPDRSQRYAIAVSVWKDAHKESSPDNPIFCNVSGYETKEIDGYLVKSGYIATTHLDSGFYDSERDIYVRDRISKETLDKWSEEINSGNPRANKMSINHNRQPHVAGVMKKGSARVDQLPDGEWGLYVDTIVDKTRDDFDDTKTRFDNGTLDSFSIEFHTKDPFTGEYLPGAVFEQFTGGSGVIRTLLPGSVLDGATYASQPMNEYAVMLKEVLESKKKISFNNEKSNISAEKFKEETPMAEQKEETIPVQEEKKEKVAAAPKEEKKEMKNVISSDEMARFEKFKEFEAKEARKQEVKELVAEIKNELVEELKEIMPEKKGMVNKNFESKEYEKFKEAVKTGSEADINSQFSIAGKMVDAFSIYEHKERSVEWKQRAGLYSEKFSTNGTKLEYKGLGLTTNANSDTDYLLSSAEFSDAFDPVIYNYLNQSKVAWSILQKDDYSNKGNDKVQFTLKTAANATAAAYTGNAITTGNVSRLKYETKFKKYQVGVEVDGDAIAAARGGPIGDLYAREVSDSSEDLLEVMNTALFAEVGLETASGVIGFEYITDSAGNTTLYNLTRSATNRLSPDSAGDTYINGNSVKVSKANLRSAIRQAKKEGAKVQNLVFITSFEQEDMIRSIYDDAQRLVPTSQRFGFEGMMTFDGIPVFGDKACNTDDIFLVDLETHRIAIWVPPTMEMLGKDSDSEKGFIKSYWCTYNRAPRRMVQIYGNATS